MAVSLILVPLVVAALAALIGREGFFALNDAYSNASIDGVCAITGVAAGGQRKMVQNCNGAGPSNLKGIEDAIDALANKVIWTDAQR